MARLKKLSKRAIALIVCGVILTLAGLGFAIMQVLFMQAEKYAPWRPDYDKVPLSAILDKTNLSESDYETIYRQTGLTKIGADRMIAKGSTGKSKILALQTAYFAEHTVEHDLFSPLICTDFIDEYIPCVFLEDGDILVTDSTHLSGWRMGHAGLVTDGGAGEVLQASAYGSSSDLGTTKDFTDRITFMVLSPRVDPEIKKQVANYARENLLGKIYDVTCGVLSSKNKVERTQCAHIVWYAYKQFGIDLDSNGGLVVTPRNLAQSPLVDVVQVFGFNPQKLWN